MKTRQIPKAQILVVQLIVVVAIVASFAAGSVSKRKAIVSMVTRETPVVVIPREVPLIIEPLYDDPEVVSDQDLGAVLTKLQPRFAPEKLKPNHVEHALRTWWLTAKFKNPKVMSGEAMKEFLTDHGHYLASWGKGIAPLLQDEPTGVSIRWGKEECASVHHDHWLACLTEAGIGLHEPVNTPSRRKEIADVLQESLRTFRVDEHEVEWSAMAFGLWIVPQKSWITNDGREVSFDLLADRLMRGHKRFGVCSGTHRLYSLVVLIRLDDDHHILSEPMRERIFQHLKNVRDLIAVCQFDDGHWPSNWSDGKEAIEFPVEDELYKKVIATGHHLEWMAIAPQELHVSHDQIVKAAQWAIATTKAQSAADIAARYTFFSHVANALSLWRKTHPVDFWTKWQEEHPESAADPEPASEPPKTDAPQH